jgi:hypothetical protein
VLESENSLAAINKKANDETKTEKKKSVLLFSR